MLYFFNDQRYIHIILGTGHSSNMVGRGAINWCSHEGWFGNIYLQNPLCVICPQKHLHLCRRWFIAVLETDKWNERISFSFWSSGSCCKIQLLEVLGLRPPFFADCQWGAAVHPGSCPQTLVMWLPLNKAPHFFKAGRRLSLQEPLQRRSQIMWCIQGSDHPTRQKWTLSRKLLITSWTYSGLLWRWFLACGFYLITDQKIRNCAVSLHCVFYLQLLKTIDLQTPTLYLWSDQGRIKVNYTKLRKNTIPETLSFLLARCPAVTCTNIS